MNDWPFDQPPNCAVLTMRQIIDGAEPILCVVHDADDNGWQFFGTTPASENDAVVVSLQNIINLDGSIETVADLPPDWVATRDHSYAPFTREPQLRSNDNKETTPPLSSLAHGIFKSAEHWHMILEYGRAAEDLRHMPVPELGHRKVLHLRARVHWGLREIPQALACIDELLDLDPEGRGPYVFKAMLLAFAGRYAEAFDLLMSVVEKFPSNATLHYDLACYAAKLKRWPEAQYWAKFSVAVNEKFRGLILRNDELKPIHHHFFSNPSQ